MIYVGTDLKFAINIPRTQRYVYVERGTSLSGRAAMADFPGQTYYNEATGITYTFRCANSNKNAWAWETSMGSVSSLDHPNGYDETSNPIEYATELSSGECVICNGVLYKWDGTEFVNLTNSQI